MGSKRFVKIIAKVLLVCLIAGTAAGCTNEGVNNAPDSDSKTESVSEVTEQASVSSDSISDTQSADESSSTAKISIPQISIPNISIPEPSKQESSKQESSKQESSKPSQTSAPQTSKPSQTSTTQSSKPSQTSTPQSSKPSQTSTPQTSKPSQISTPQSSKPSQTSTPQQSSAEKPRFSNPDAKKIKKDTLSINPSELYYDGNDLVAVCYICNGYSKTLKDIDVVEFTISNDKGVIASKGFGILKDVTIAPDKSSKWTFRFSGSDIKQNPDNFNVLYWESKASFKQV